MSALNLQSVFTGEATDRFVQIRYDTQSREIARRVAQDLLDVLLAAYPSQQGFSLLSEFALLSKLPMPCNDMCIASKVARTVRIRKVKTLESRLFAMAMTDNLMFASARINKVILRPKPYDARSFRTHWLWTLIPSRSLNLLTERIENWPAVYIRACWPELHNIEKIPMLQRKKALIILCANRDNSSALQCSLANIRSN